MKRTPFPPFTLQSQTQTHSHSNAHLDPNTPLSSSNTVLSLFCSSLSRSLASASSCQRKTESYSITRLPLLGHADYLNWGGGVGEYRHEGRQPGRWWPPTHSACHLCHTTLEYKSLSADMTACRVIQHCVSKVPASSQRLHEGRIFIQHYMFTVERIIYSPASLSCIHVLESAGCSDPFSDFFS